MPTKNKRSEVRMSLLDLQLALQCGLSLDETKLAKQLNIPPENLAYAKSTKLYKAIQKKLAERKVVVCLAYNTLMALKAKKYAGSPDDKITNPLAICDPKNDYGAAIYSTVAEKRIAYNRALDEGAVAYIGFNQTIPLGAPGAEFNDVEYVAGLWRVQRKFPYQITDVRDKQFVLVEKLHRNEKNKFEYYRAAAAIWCGTGCSADVEHPDWIVAKYETPCGTYWAYGQTIEQARAFLAISIYDAYQDLIHANAFKKTK